MVNSWPKDNLAAKIAFYGDPRGANGKSSVKWERENLVSIQTPFQMYYAGQKLKTIRVHRKIATAVVAALLEIKEKCGNDPAKIDATGASEWGGCFNYRLIAGSGNLSNHCFGCAIDLQPSKNGFNTGKGKISPIVVNAFKRQGALWGGDYKGRTDPMHLEFVSR